MASGIQFTNYVPQFLNGINSPSPTLAAEVATGLPIPTGAFPGNAFFLSEQQANQLSNNVCHAGWYMVAQVDAGATAGNIAFGTVGHQASIAGSNTAPGALLVSSADKGISAGVPGINPVVFLGAVTPGNYTIVQLAGDGQLLASAAIAAVGSLLAYATTGRVATLAAASNLNAQNTIAGISKATTAGAGLVRVEIAFPWGVI